jgi:hypothetical protein
MTDQQHGASGLEGARIVYVESLTEPFKWVLVFAHRGTDDDSGWMVVDGSDIHFNDGGDPDVWKNLNALAGADAEKQGGER